MWHVIQLCLYPVKGLRGCPVPALEFDELGPVGDRRFLIMDPSGRFLTQRTLPRLATISPVLTAASLTLHAPGAGAVAAPTEVNFGLNLIHETPAGTLRVGDPVTPL